MRPGGAGLRPHAGIDALHLRQMAWRGRDTELVAHGHLPAGRATEPRGSIWSRSKVTLRKGSPELPGCPPGPGRRQAETPISATTEAPEPSPTPSPASAASAAGADGLMYFRRRSEEHYARPSWSCGPPEEHAYARARPLGAGARGPEGTAPRRLPVAAPGEPAWPASAGAAWPCPRARRPLTAVEGPGAARGAAACQRAVAAQRAAASSTLGRWPCTSGRPRGLSPHRRPCRWPRSSERSLTEAPDPNSSRCPSGPSPPPARRRTPDSPAAIASAGARRR